MNFEKIAKKLVYKAYAVTPQQSIADVVEEATQALRQAYASGLEWAATHAENFELSHEVSGPIRHRRDEVLNAVEAIP